MLHILPKSCLIVPCYNEAQRLPTHAFVDFLNAAPGVELCFVNDGSQDATEEALHDLARACRGRASVLSLAQNVGKAEAVRQGIRHVLNRSTAEFVGYWDADLATPLAEVQRFLDAGREFPELQGILGCRIKRLGASIHRDWRRHVLGRVFATLADFILALPVYDTQCGAKLFRADLAEEIFAEPFLSRWCFDVELIARVVAARGRAATRRILLEIPLHHWEDVPGSKLRLKHYVWAIRDLARIYWHYRWVRSTSSTWADGEESAPEDAKPADVCKAA